LNGPLGIRDKHFEIKIKIFAEMGYENNHRNVITASSNLPLENALK
jgi:hypothetical protein